jgi:hypothetical protein
MYTALPVVVSGLLESYTEQKLSFRARQLPAHLAAEGADVGLREDEMRRRTSTAGAPHSG